MIRLGKKYTKDSTDVFGKYRCKVCLLYYEYNLAENFLNLI